MHHVAGIILSISIITALGLAVYENPQVQAWLEEQRKNLMELLRSIGEELDPQTRRQAEAFAFEGRTTATDPNLKREAVASRDAAAIATGRSLSNASAVRRIPIQGPSDPDAAEERRRQGREYLARRNQQMYDLQQRRKDAKADGLATPPTPTSFDALVDGEGKLKRPSQDVELPDVPCDEPLPERIQKQMREVERALAEPLLASTAASGSSGWQFGSQLANPFGDEYAMDRSETPKPAVPPKIQLEDTPSESTDLQSMRPVSPRPILQSERSHSPVNTEELSYEEQMAIALSLSDQDSANSATVRQRHSLHEDDELQAAIEASLRDMDDQQAAHAVANPVPLTPKPNAFDHQPLVDLTSDPPISLPAPQARSPWETLFQQQSPSQQLAAFDPPTSVPASVDDNDELYRVTPELTRARLATHTQLVEGDQPRTHLSTSSARTVPYDPVHEAAQEQQQQPQVPMEASFYSAASSVSRPSSNTFHSESPQLVDVTEDAEADATQSFATWSSATADEAHSDSDTFASVSAPRSRAASQAPSQISDVEVVDVEHDTEDDVMSDDGIATPDSWTEVGSRDGDSEVSEMEDQRRTGVAP